MLDSIGSVIGQWLDGLGNLIGDLVGNVDDVLSSIVGIIPRSVIFIRSLLTPVTQFIEKAFGGGFTAFFFGTSAITILFLAVVGFIVALGLKRSLR